MTGGRPVNVLMDVDTGVDDAMALAMAVESPDIHLVGVTTVAGNVDREQATHNTLRVLDLLGATEVMVCAGMSRPLAREHFDAAHFHGGDGLGGAPFPAPTRTIRPTSAPEFIVQQARAYGGALTLVMVGPLTNLAVALALEPELPRLIDRTMIMGGAFDVPGNATPYAEFNIGVDPEAARWVAESGLNATWIGLDVTHSVSLYRDDWERLAGLECPPATVVREVCRQSFDGRGLESVHLHDPLTVGSVLKPDLLETRRSAVSVDTSLRGSAGMTRMMTDSRATWHDIAINVDSESFRELFGTVLGLERLTGT